MLARAREVKALLESGQTSAALALLDDALAADAVGECLDTECWQLHLLRARALEQEGSLEEALSSCTRALNEAPSNEADPWLTLGSLHTALGARMTALECFREAAKVEGRELTARHLITGLGGRDFSAPLLGEVAELFDRYSERFDEHLVAELGYTGHNAIPKVLTEVAGGEESAWQVMDLGCGTGLCGEGLRPMAGVLIGVDVAPRMVQKARARGVYDLAFAADLVYALACRSSASVDLISSADVLGYVGDLAAFYAEAARVLRRGGRLAFTVEAAADDNATYQMAASRRCRYGRNYLLALAERFGFAVERFDAAALRREAGVDVVEFVVVLRIPLKA